MEVKTDKFSKVLVQEFGILKKWKVVYAKIVIASNLCCEVSETTMIFAIVIFVFLIAMIVTYALTLYIVVVYYAGELKSF